MFKAFLGLITATLLIQGVQAAPAPQQAGWSGDLNLNAGMMYRHSQFNTNNDNAITHDLNNSGRSHNQALAYPLLNFAYTTESLKHQFFAGNSKETIGQAQFQYELGYHYALSKRSQLTVAYFPKLPFLSETWSDPYLTDTQRDKTNENYQGFRLRYAAIADSPLTLTYSYVHRSIDNERSGAALFGLDSEQAQALRRNANLHRFGAELSFPLSPSWIISPALRYTLASAEGQANDYNHYSIQLNNIFRQGRHLLTLNLKLDQLDYQHPNPVFNQQIQTDKSASIFAIYMYQQPFQWENTLFNVITGYSHTDSNIAFFDARGAMLALGFGYHF